MQIISSLVSIVFLLDIIYCFQQQTIGKLAKELDLHQSLKNVELILNRYHMARKNITLNEVFFLKSKILINKLPSVKLENQLKENILQIDSGIEKMVSLTNFETAIPYIINISRRKNNILKKVNIIRSRYSDVKRNNLNISLINNMLLYNSYVAVLPYILVETWYLKWEIEHLQKKLIMGPIENKAILNRLYTKIASLEVYLDSILRMDCQIQKESISFFLKFVPNSGKAILHKRDNETEESLSPLFYTNLFPNSPKLRVILLMMLFYLLSSKKIFGLVGKVPKCTPFYSFTLLLELAFMPLYVYSFYSIANMAMGTTVGKDPVISIMPIEDQDYLSMIRGVY